MMEINFKELLCSISDALDFVESDLFGIKKDHGKHVAYMAAQMGRTAGLGEDEISNLMACALLHDNALTEFREEGQTHGNLFQQLNSPSLATHCIYGEKNVTRLSFYPKVRNVILYHHEWGNGRGPFGKTWREVPYYSRLIHLADAVDVMFYSDWSKSTADRAADIRAFIHQHQSTMFDNETVYLFDQCIDDGIIQRMDETNVYELINESFPESMREYDYNGIINIGSIFSKIVDYKSSFTRRHSRGIAEKALVMAEHYGWEKEEQAKYYLAGALHDIGKLAVRTSVLEKPGKLTDEEFAHIKNHAQITWQVLHRIHGFEEITEWAANHHERLDGSGYPNGKTADQLSFKDRLLACIDVYQALREDRPYRAGLTHVQSMAILHKDVAAGHLDAQCVADIDAVLRDSKA